MKLNRDHWLLLAISAPPVVWFALLSLAYWAVPGAHEPGRLWLLRGMHIGASLLVVIALALIAREIRLTTGDGNDVVVQRRRFLAIAGFALGALVLLVIIGMAVPTFMLWTGAEP